MIMENNKPVNETEKKENAFKNKKISEDKKIVVKKFFKVSLIKKVK